jgi:hypothetical protein
MISLKSINQMIFVKEKYCVLFAVRTESLSFNKMSFGFKGLILLLLTRAQNNEYTKHFWESSYIEAQ